MKSHKEDWWRGSCRRMEEGEGVQQWDVGCVEDFFFSEWIKLYFCGGFFVLFFLWKSSFQRKLPENVTKGWKSQNEPETRRRWTKHEEWTFFCLSVSIWFNLSFVQRWQCSSLRSPCKKSVCEHSCLGDEQCVCVDALLFFPSFWLGFPSICAFACSSLSWWSVFQTALRSPLPQSEGGEKKKCRVRWQRVAVDRCAVPQDWGPLCVFTSQLPLRSRLNSGRPLFLHAHDQCSLNVMLTWLFHLIKADASGLDR